MATKKKPSPKKPAAKVAEHLPKKDLFRIDEAAEYFGVTPRTIRLWIDHGKLEFEKIEGCIRIPRTAILEIRFFTE